MVSSSFSHTDMAHDIKISHYIDTVQIDSDDWRVMSTVLKYHSTYLFH